MTWGLPLVALLARSLATHLCTDTRFLVDILDAQRPLYGHTTGSAETTLRTGGKDCEGDNCCTIEVGTNKSAAALLCTDTRFLADILVAQRPLYGYRHLLILHGNATPFDVLCNEDLPRLHGTYTTMLHTNSPVTGNWQWNMIDIDLIVLMLGTGKTDILNTTIRASLALGAFKYLKPLLVIHTAELETGGDPDGRADVDKIATALRITGWMHTIITVHRHTSDCLQTVPVYLSRPGFVPGARCGFGPSTTTLALTWSAGVTLGEDAVYFLEPYRHAPLNGCDVNVLPMEAAPFASLGGPGGNTLFGLDINLVRYFAADSNATVHFLPLVAPIDSKFIEVNRWGRLQLTATPEKETNSIHHEEADMVVGGVFPTVERTKAFDLTAPYWYNNIWVYVTARVPVAAWRYPFGVLCPGVWAAVCGTIVLLVVVLQAIGGGSGLENVMILHGILFDGEPQPKLRSWTKQAVGLVFLWTVFCMHFNSGYRASLAMASINPIGKPGPKGIEDINRVGIIFDVVANLLKDYPSKRVRGIQIENCHTYSNCSAHIRSDPENMGFITSEISMWAETPEHFLDSDLKNLLATREKLASYSVSFLINKGSPLLEHVNRALVKSQEVGLVREAQVAWAVYLKRIVGNKQRKHRPRGEQGFKIIIGALGLLLAGLALATLVFCGELVHYQTRSKHGRS